MKEKKNVDLSIVIASFNTEKLTRECIESVVASTKKAAYEFIVIDNASVDGSVAMLTSLANSLPINLIKNKVNVGFGGANNQGMKLARGRYILLLNSDTLVKSPVLDEMVAWMDKNEDVGITSPALKFPNGSVQGTGGYFPTLGRVMAWMSFVDDLPVVSRVIKSFHPMHGLSPLDKNESFFSKSHNMDWLTGAFFLMRREVYEAVGDFDGDYFMYVEEVDYCHRAKSLGWKIVYLPKWNIVHYGGASSTNEFPLVSEMKGVVIFYKKHYPKWKLPILRFILKIGCTLRILVFGIWKGPSVAKIYVKAFKQI